MASFPNRCQHIKVNGRVAQPFAKKSKDPPCRKERDKGGAPARPLRAALIYTKTEVKIPAPSTSLRAGSVSPKKRRDKDGAPSWFPDALSSHSELWGCPTLVAVFATGWGF